MNSLWSIWGGIFTACLEVYIASRCVRRYTIYTSLPWPADQQPDQELNLYLGLVILGVVLLPFMFISYMFKIGNLSNDGHKLGYSLSTCSMDPPSALPRQGGACRQAWQHSGPMASLLHLLSAFCFLLPRVFVQARLVQAGFLSRGEYCQCGFSVHNMFQIIFG